ncbi:MAG TPA: thioesterase family protein [Marmoricola sp.]|nr:thioesterase family protein [Marmoricola sp.]
MRHTYECPMRWADMDLLGHVNNVTYLEYVAEARLDMFGGDGAGRARVARHRVQFVAPLVFHRHPVRVDSWVSCTTDDEVTLEHEVYDLTEDDGGGELRKVYVRATTVLAHRLDAAELEVVDRHRGAAQEWRDARGPARPPRASWPLRLRRSDVDERGEASDVAHFEFFQEARIQYVMNLHTRGQKWSQHVVASTDIEYHAPVPPRAEPYAVRSWVGSLGNRSFTIESELCDGDQVLATAAVVMVAFDMDTQRPTEMADTQRARLGRELAAD